MNFIYRFIKNKGVYIFLFIIILGGFFLRIYKINDVSYWIDEGFTIMQTKAIISHGYPLLDSGRTEIKDMLLPYLLAGPIKFFGESPFVFRIISILFGIASIFLAFILGKKIFNEKVGLVFSFLISFSYWNIAWSRQARGYSLLLFFTFLFVFFIIIYNNSEKKLYIFIALVSAIAATLSKSLGLFLFPTLVVYIFLKRKYIIGMLFFFLFLIFAIFFRHLIINALDVNLVNYLGFYLVGYLWMYFGIAFSLSIAGIILAFKNNINNCEDIHLSIVILFFTALLGLSFFVYINQGRYLFFITPFIFLYTSYFLFYISNIFNKKNLVLFFLIFLFIIIDLFTTNSFVFYPKTVYYLEEYTPQPNFNLAYKYIEKNITKNDFVVSAYPFMDRIYLNKSDYAIAISYTGRKGDTNVEKLKEYYSGTKKLYGKGDLDAIDKLEFLRGKGNIYIILDDMALSKIKNDIRVYIVNSYNDLFESDDLKGQRIFVYKLSENI